MKEFIKLNTDPAEVIELFPDLDGKGNVDGSKKKLKGKDLENALNALIEYLVELRSMIGQNKPEASGSQEQGSQRNVQQQLELIDTTLLKCYLQVCNYYVSY
jgi:Vam6/Vps39-like protein vacuolar protein sorting-associated protein 39